MRVDILNGQDVRDYHWTGQVDVQGVLMAPPCTEFAGSGARWWADKPPELLDEAIDTVRACLRITDEAHPKWWALENPVGRLARMVPELGKWLYTFQPWEYGDPEVKRTCIWGEHKKPVKTPVAGPYTARVHRMAPSPDRQRLRSITPPGFAQAFFETNP